MGVARGAGPLFRIVSMTAVLVEVARGCGMSWTLLGLGYIYHRLDDTGSGPTGCDAMRYLNGYELTYGTPTHSSARPSQSSVKASRSPRVPLQALT
jgi:hypothetical protein